MRHNPHYNIQVHCSTSLLVFRNEMCTKVVDCLYYTVIYDMFP